MPRWCDLSCPEASFPPAEAVDGAGSCRTFAALYCARLGQLVHKHGLCQCPDDPPPPPDTDKPER